MQALELVELFAEHGHVFKLARSLSRDRRAARAAFQRQYIGTGFTNVARDRPAAGADFQHFSAAQQLAKRAHQVGAQTAQVV